MHKLEMYFFLNKKLRSKMCGVCSFSSLQPLALTDAHAGALFHLNYGNIVILHIDELLNQI